MSANKILSAVLAISLLVNIAFIFNIKGKDVSLPKGTSKIEIQPKVVVRDKIIYIEQKNPDTGEKKHISDDSRNLKVLEESIPVVKIDPIVITQERKKVIVPDKINGTVSYGYIKNDIEIELTSEIYSRPYLDIKAVTLWSPSYEAKFIHDYQLALEIFDTERLSVNAGLGMRMSSLLCGFDLFGNVEFQAGLSYLYGNGFSPSLGFSVKLF